MNIERIKWVINCLSDELAKGRLTDWEEKFLQSTDKIFREKGSLTEKNYKRLEEVYERIQAR